ncbi:MAG: Sec-independent protein translocase protein TatB, partial [Terriglobales bacterium]
MFDLSWSHILIVLIVALVVVGPKDLPRLMHMIGRWMGKARAMANEFRKSFDEMARQAELDELRKEIEALRNERPLASVARALDQSILPPDQRSVLAAAEEVMMPIDHSKVDEEPAVHNP